MTHIKRTALPIGQQELERISEKLRATADALESASSQQQVTRIFSRLSYSARRWHEWSAATEGVTVVDRRDEWRAKFNTSVQPTAKADR